MILVGALRPNDVTSGQLSQVHLDTHWLVANTNVAGLLAGGLCVCLGNMRLDARWRVATTNVTGLLD